MQKIKLIPKQVIVSEIPDTDPLCQVRRLALERLEKTDLRKDLCVPVELAIREKSRQEAKLLRTGEATIYANLARHIIDNLQPDNMIGNKNLVVNINEGQITPQELMTLRPQDIHTERWRSFVEKSNVMADALTKDPVATTRIYVCGKCHRNKCRYFERQDRSADEAKTVHITCCFCGNKWRN